jgi:nucleoside phosphorylase
MASGHPPGSRKDFHVAIICALPLEANAITLLFDHLWDDQGDPYGRADGDDNTYITGRMGKHNAVLVVLPSMGTNSAAAAAASMRSSYNGIRLAVLVGICGGVPRIGECDAFLGDVIVSRSITQYDYGRHYPGHFAVKDSVEDSLARANKDIRALLAAFETALMRERLQDEASAHLKHLQQAASPKRRSANYGYPGTVNDNLYRAAYAHKHRNFCPTGVCGSDGASFCELASKASCAEAGCNPTELVTRLRLEDTPKFRPEIFIGRIGSGNTMMKNGVDRDRIAAQHDLIAFEMEGAGAWDEFPCIVVKGICAYADSHKNKSWQNFAAATAASVAKAILGRYAVRDGDRDPAGATNSKIQAFER